jgi:hypothetical protein
MHIPYVVLSIGANKTVDWPWSCAGLKEAPDKGADA